VLTQRELTHAGLAGVQNSITRFLDFGQLFNLHFNNFLHGFFTVFLLHLVHIKPMQTFPHINTPLNLNISSHYLLLLTLSPL